MKVKPQEVMDWVVEKFGRHGCCAREFLAIALDWGWDAPTPEERMRKLDLKTAVPPAEEQEVKEIILRLCDDFLQHYER